MKDKIKEIEIYPSISQTLFLTIISLIFSVMGWIAYIKEGIMIASIGAIFLGITGVFVGFYNITLRFLHKPVLKIYENRIENYTFLRKCQTYFFEEIEIFTTMKISGVTFIYVHFLNSIEKYPKPLNTITIDNPRKINNLLNEYLEMYWEEQK